MRRFPLVVSVLAAAALVSGCESTSSATSKPADPVAAPPAAAAVASVEDPEKRNERLLRLEFSGDQWWGATQRQEWAKVASLETLIGDYVISNYDAVLSDLKLGSPRHRRAMAFALGFSRRTESVAPLAEALKDTYYEVVLHALLGLYELAKNGETVAMVGGKLVPSPLVIDPEWVLPHLRHPREEVRSNAALLLSRIVGPTTPKSTLLVIVAATEDTDAATRVHALAALGATGDKEAYPYLVKALNDAVELVRIRAALALGRVGDKDAVPYLVAVLAASNEKVDVKRAAAKSLREITGETIESIDAAAWKPVADKLAPSKDD